MKKIYSNFFSTMDHMDQSRKVHETLLENATVKKKETKIERKTKHINYFSLLA